MYIGLLILNLGLTYFENWNAMETTDMKHNTAYTEQMRDWQRRSGWTKRRRYEESAALANEIHYGCQIGSRADRNIWAARFYDYPWALGAIRERAYACASCRRQGLLRNAVTAFQKWLDENYPNPRKNGGAR